MRRGRVASGFRFSIKPNCRSLPYATPQFLSRLVALANFVRLSLRKAAYVALGGVVMWEIRVRFGRDDKFKGGGPPWLGWMWMDRVKQPGSHAYPDCLVLPTEELIWTRMAETSPGCNPGLACANGPVPAGLFVPNALPRLAGVEALLSGLNIWQMFEGPFRKRNERSLQGTAQRSQ
jgi:hypothetical protein